ncbi:MAG: VCBS repeat-containing protein [Tannerellaceae bacterium]|jgi:hypothetical protein|nr:VCBS repeat-containing protein [Tannerellaceae bacterium]
MRKLVTTKIFFIVVLLICAITQMEAVTVYVSPTGSGTGWGTTSGSPVNITRFKAIFDGYLDHTKADPDSAIFYARFAPGTYTLPATLTLNQNQGGILFVLEKDPASTNARSVIFQPANPCNATGSSGTEIGVFRSSAQDPEKGGCNITFRNMIFQGFRGQAANLSTTGSNGRRVFTVGHNSNVLTLDHVTIQDCNSTSTYDDLIGMGHTQQGTFYVFISEINIYNSSIINNNRGTRKIINIRNGNSRIYNNTFSNNTATESATDAAFFAEFYNHTGNVPLNALSRGYIAFVNNTVYNSGRFTLGGGGTALVANNIFAGTKSTIVNNNGLVSFCYNNIIGNAAASPAYYYYENGLTLVSTNLIPNFTEYIYFTALSYQDGGGDRVPGSHYHRLEKVNTSSHPIIDRVNNLDEIGYRVWDTEGFFNLTYDQLGKIRPQSRRAIGSIDMASFGVLNGDIRIYYNSDPTASNNIPAPKEIDLSAYVRNYPSGFSKTNTNFTIESVSLPTGSSITPIPSGAGNYITTFNPKNAPPYDGEGSFTFKVKVTSDGHDYEETATVRIQVIDLNLSGIGGSNLPGYDGATDLDDARCKIEMKPVEFNPQYKFISGKFATNITTAIPVANTDSLGQVYDYHIPLVGDLNGDGRPEIVALGRNGHSGNTNFNITVDAIHIFNGQTGKRLLSFTVPTFYPFGTSDGYHGSPGSMALIDSDRDGDIEVILAVGRNSDSNVSKRLMSYVIHYNEATEAWSMSKNPKWYTNNGAGAPIYNTTFAENNNDATQDDSNFTTPVIQIVDFNRDGRADILAYNKIFDAETGKKLLTYETLRDDPQATGSAYVGRDFKGKESWDKAHRGNSKIGFASVYDLDGDGQYEICAGGKVYYNISFNPDGAVNNGTYEVLNIMDKLPTTPVNQKAWLQGNALTGVSAVRSFTDGRTAVADIDGDGIPEIVASYYVESNFHYDKGVSTSDPDEPHDHGSENKLRIVAWNAHLNTQTVTLKAILNIPLSNYGTSGTYSYMYIADVDGRSQNGQKLPEISMLGPMFYCYLYGSSWTGYPIHPNVADSMAVSYPRTGGPLNPLRARGSLISFTWDNTPGLSVFDRLKVSFMMEHSDESVNTGISLFDFDNDGKNEICYRDEKTLRIIKPTKPFVPLNDADKNVTIFESNVTSNTGFEYPVIVDLDGDYSGDMLVSGSTAGKKSTRDFLYAIQGANIDLAPARTVWNQFMYSPLKVTDSIRVPLPPKFPPHPLSPDAAFYKTVSDSYETYIYNMNIGQVPYFSVENTGGKAVYAPLVKIPNAVISDLEFVSSGSSTVVDTIQFVISNAGEAAINEYTPIKIYDGEIALAGKRYRSLYVGSAVYPGENVTIKVPLTAVADNGKTFLIRVGDDSFEDDKGDVFLDEKYDELSSFADCDWTDNFDILSYFYLKPDYYTVLPGETVVLDILKNDILTLFLPAIKTINDFTVVHQAGSTATMSVVNQKLQFRAPETGGLICYKYNLNENSLSTGYIYIYVAELDDPRTLLCEGQSYELKVKPLPAGVTFEYYESDSTTVITGNPTFTASMSHPRDTFYVKPLTVTASIPTAGTSIGAFLPKKRIDFKVTTSGATTKMKWTGLGHNYFKWHDPGNWVEVDEDGKESSVTYFPNSCVDVIIPSGSLIYPVLDKEAACHDITIEDRAMIAGIHWLTYNNARVELTLDRDEKERFLTWSAPLKSMYSGDYHYEDVPNIAKWGDVYMNFFQYANPDYSNSAVEGTFTATFGTPNATLDKGKAFNLKVTPTAGNEGKSFVFPRSTPSYSVEGKPPYNTPRPANSGKFIVDKDDSTPLGSATTQLPVVNDIAGSTMVQIVNPYMAVLDMDAFLQANSSQLVPNVYAIWNGLTIEQYGTIGTPANRYHVSTVGWRTVVPGSSFMPPLQSFFAQKVTPANKITAVTMSDAWTNTIEVALPYKLRAADAPETNILRIKATQDDGKRVSYAVLHYNESTSPAYKSSEDMHKLFYQLEEDVIPLEVYTFAPTQEVLAINSSSNFSQNVPLGLRTDKTGEVTLEFSGMATFGHNVYLIDHADNDKVTDLQKNPVYKFTVAKKSASDKLIELNDRFSLRSDYTGIGLDNEAISTTGLNVTSRDGYIYVQTQSPASSLQVYSLTGALVYSSTMRSDYFRISTDGQQAYIVKVKIDEEYLTQKVFVK